MTTEKSDAPRISEKDVRELLKGIDSCDPGNSEDEEGWWETSTGATFGEKKLNELIALLKPVLMD